MPRRTRLPLLLNCCVEFCLCGLGPLPPLTESCYGALFPWASLPLCERVNLPASHWRVLISHLCWPSAMFGWILIPTLVPDHQLKRSKGDPFGQGVLIHLGRTFQSLCPVSTVLSYLAIRPSTPGHFLYSQMVPPCPERG